MLTLAAPLAGLASARYGAWGVDLTGGDTAITPGDDFFDYANGAWFAKARIPRDGSGIGVDYDLRNAAQLRAYDIILRDRSNPAADPDAARVGDFYTSFMDVGQVERLDAAPLTPALDTIKGAADRTALARWMGHTMGAFGGSIFGAGVEEDGRRPGQYVLTLMQGGAWLPDRNYYLQPAFAAQKAAYRLYVARSLQAIGWADADAAADSILAMETRIAEVSWSNTEQMDDRKTYHPMSQAELAALAPAFPWRAYFEGLGATDVDRVLVAESTAFPKIAEIYAQTPLETLKAWAAFTLVDQASPYLSSRFVESHFDFQSRTLGGVESNNGREDQAVETVGDRLSDAIGRQYVARYFPPRALERMQAMAAELKAAMADRMNKAAWMAPATKAQALEKLRRMRVMVGYPALWRDYAPLRIDKADLYGNMERSNAFEWADEIARLKRPIDPHEWNASPQTVNAYSDPIQNVVVFPAAILQPPMFDPDADMAVNYGAVGAVIGHEITHGFDNRGHNYDADGVLRDWWTPSDAARFDAEAAKLAGQYDKFEVAPGFNVNGQLTLGEDIADLGGLQLALEAYHRALGGKPAPVIDGLTGDQRFFLAWAQAWRTKDREDSMKQQAATDGHPPARFRVEGPVRNIDAWYLAFNVKPGDRDYLPPEARARIW